MAQKSLKEKRTSPSWRRRLGGFGGLMDVDGPGRARTSWEIYQVVPPRYINPSFWGISVGISMINGL